MLGGKHAMCRQVEVLGLKMKLVQNSEEEASLGEATIWF